jgi:ADP-ribose pyrophosphatase
MKEKTLKKQVIFEGRILRLELLEVELEPGTRARREIIRHPGAVVVIPELPDGRIVLVRQFRKPLERHVIEAVAGLKERGEDPRTCAAREVREETGYRAKKVNRLGSVFASPGYTDERLHLFHIELDPRRREPSLDDDERVEVLYFRPAEVDRMIATGRIFDCKTLATWLLFKEKNRRRGG